MEAQENVQGTSAIPHFAEWIAALRSGEYKQAKRRLRQMEGGECAGYCCLGVWAQVAGYKFAETWDAVIDSEGADVGYEPIIQALKAGGLETDALTFANDRLGWSFDKIADFLEGKGPSPEELAREIRDYWITKDAA